MADYQNIKRAAKRYPYIRSAICEIAGDKLEIQLINISKSGLQFASRTEINSKDPIKISWRDSKIGTFAPTLLIARNIEQASYNGFSFFYGSQYYNLMPETKEVLVRLLKTLNAEDTKENLKQVESVPTHHIFEVIDKGVLYLQAVFNGREKAAAFDSIINEIKEYEKQAFLKNDTVSLIIQKAATHHFHCMLLLKMIPLVVEKTELQPQYFKQVLQKQAKISESEIDKEVREQSSNADLQFKSALIESSKRLFYGKQALLHAVVKNFRDKEFKVGECKSMFESIKIHYQKILDITNASRPEEVSRVDVIVDLQPVTNQKKNSLVWIIVFLVILVGVGLGAYRLAPLFRIR